MSVGTMKDQNINLRNPQNPRPSTPSSSLGSTSSSILPFCKLKFRSVFFFKIQRVITEFYHTNIFWKKERKKWEKTVKNVEKESGGKIGKARGGAEADAQVKRGVRASDM